MFRLMEMAMTLMKRSSLSSLVLTKKHNSIALMFFYLSRKVSSVGFSEGFQVKICFYLRSVQLLDFALKLFLGQFRNIPFCTEVYVERRLNKLGRYGNLHIKHCR